MKKIKVSNKNSGLFTKTIISLFIIVLNTNSFQAQKSNQKINASVGIETFSSGNGHGAFFSPQLNLIKGKNTFNGGPVLQKRTQLMKGFKVGYSRELTIDSSDVSEHAEKNLFQLHFFSSFQYTKNLPLSYSTVKNEKMIWGDSKPGIEKIVLTTCEINIGFELYVNITNQISWKNQIAASAYYNTNYSTKLEHQKFAPTLYLGTGLCFFLK
ncbi:MAG: hypothetical protein Q8T03_14455 [Bacteroidota bacterium]|nr:hypothetical protein [Bacteroidota bacterium]